MEADPKNNLSKPVFCSNLWLFNLGKLLNLSEFQFLYILITSDEHYFLILWGLMRPMIYTINNIINALHMVV